MHEGSQLGETGGIFEFACKNKILDTQNLGGVTDPH